MTPTATALNDTPRRPWRNGGGVTRELLAWPDKDDWRLRISVADIEADGPFSTFPGVQRWFAVLQGGGVALTIAGEEHVRRPGDAALQFSGAAAVSCRLLHGMSRDLNLMLRGTTGMICRVVDGEAWTPAARRCGLYAVAKGRCHAGSTAIDVPAETLLWFAEAPDALTFHLDTTARVPVAGWWLAADIAEAGA